MMVFFFHNRKLMPANLLCGLLTKTGILCNVLTIKNTDFHHTSIWNWFFNNINENPFPTVIFSLEK